MKKKRAWVNKNIQNIDHSNASNPNAKKKFTKKTKSNKKLKVRKTMRSIFLGGVLLVVILFVSPLYQIRSINVSGMLRTSEKDLLSNFRQSIGKNWFFVAGAPRNFDIFQSEELANEILLRYPYVVSARVEFRWFGNLQINIVERKPKFLILKGLQYLMVDGEGVILEKVDPISRPKLPILEGLTIQNERVGGEIKFKEPYVLEKTRFFLNLLLTTEATTDKSLIDEITAINFSKSETFSFTLDDRLKVIFSDVENLKEYNINFVKEVYYNRLMNKERGVLDFSGKDSVGIFSPE